jgi:hypothetical protein
MDGRSEAGKSERRKQYIPPQITTISLRPEEAVLGGCKSPSNGNGAGGTCFLVGGCPSQAS